MLRELKCMLGSSLFAGLLLVSLSPAQALEMDNLLPETEATRSDIGLYSQYVWRGQRQSAGAMSVQGDIGLAHDSGASVNAWFATMGAGNKSTEFDITLDYSADLGFMEYSAGLILYRYHNNDAANTSEVYVGVNHDLGSATLYYNPDLKDTWIDLSSGIELAEMRVDGTLSYAMPDIGKSEFVNLAVGISKDVEFEDVLISPSFTYNYHMGALSNILTPDALVFAVNVAY
ncbi:MAG: TorF family putative porin [Ghiorsea sp.]